MKTLLLSEIFPPEHGGSGRWLWEIYSRLPRDRFVIAAGQHDGAAAFDTTHELDVRRLPLTMNDWGIRSWQSLRSYWGLYRKLRRIIRQENVTAIHCGRCLPEGWLAYLFKKLLNIPYVCYIHGEDVTSAATSRELSWMLRGILAQSDTLIANSENTARLLRENWPVSENQVQVLHPGVDTTRFAPAARDEAVRNRFDWNHRTVVLTVGRLQKRKGHDMMIRALPAIREAVPDVLFAIVGDGAERLALEQLARDEQVESHVQFLGEVSDEDMIRGYQQCDLFALPNRQVGQDIEGFGMVLLEAQSCGRPVLAGASGGTRETMIPGETGIVTPCENPDQVAEAVTPLLLAPDELQKMGEAARPWAVNNFDWTALSHKAAQLFDVELPPSAEDAALHSAETAPTARSTEATTGASA
jgi:phosphatidylinositol alpha-1,6-mannosyltransferase